MTIQIPFCYTCPFWDITEFIPSERDADKQESGETDEEFIVRLSLESRAVHAPCRRNAPRYADILPASRGQSDAGAWSYTSNYDWCGEHPDFAAYLTRWLAKRDAVGRGYGVPNYYGVERS